MNKMKLDQAAEQAADCKDMESKSKRIDWHEKHYDLLNIMKGTDKGLKNWEFRKEYYFQKRVKFADALILTGSKDWKSDVQKSENPIVRRFFRRVNYMEVKGPNDNLTVDDIHHAMTGTTMALEELYTEEKATPDEMATTFIVAHKPLKILKYMEAMKKKMHVTIDARISGIWRIRGYGSFPIQIIATAYLKNRKLQYMKALTKLPGKKERDEVLKQIEKFEGRFPDEVANITAGFRELNPLKVSEEGGQMEAVMKGLFPEEYEKHQKYLNMLESEKKDLEQANQNLEQANQNLEQANQNLEQANQNLAIEKTGLSEDKDRLIEMQARTIRKLKTIGFSNQEILEIVGIDEKTLQEYLEKGE